MDHQVHKNLSHGKIGILYGADFFVVRSIMKRKEPVAKKSLQKNEP